MGAALSGVVQLAEHGSHNPDVVGSSPAPATNKKVVPGGSNLSRFGVIQSQSRRVFSPQNQALMFKLALIIAFALVAALAKSATRKM